MSGATSRFLRTRLALALFVWMSLTVLAALGAGRLKETIGPTATQWVLVIVALSPLLPLLAWSLFAVARRPRLNWPAPMLLIAFCVVFTLGFETLIWAGGYLNFLTHRDAYARVVADSKAGRLPPSPKDAYGYRYGVRYRAFEDEPAVVYFDWGELYGFFGVVYDERCTPAALTRSRPEPPPPAPPQIDGEPDPPTIRGAGRLGWWKPLEAHYCLHHEVM